MSTGNGVQDEKKDWPTPYLKGARIRLKRIHLLSLISVREHLFLLFYLFFIFIINFNLIYCMLAALGIAGTLTLQDINMYLVF
jgi:hypothetical protein